MTTCGQTSREKRNLPEKQKAILKNPLMWHFFRQGKMGHFMFPFSQKQWQIEEQHLRDNSASPPVLLVKEVVFLT